MTHDDALAIEASLVGSNNHHSQCPITPKRVGGFIELQNDETKKNVDCGDAKLSLPSHRPVFFFLGLEGLQCGAWQVVSALHTHWRGCVDTDDLVSRSV